MADKGPYLEGSNHDIYVSQDPYGRQILTVGQLKALIADLPDETHVVLDDNDGGGWYHNVAHTAVPVLDEGGEYGTSDWQCVTFFQGAAFDSRQF